MTLTKEIEFYHTVVPSILSIPTHIDTYGGGGYMCVENYTDLLDIPKEYLKDGTLAYISNEGAYYHYNNGGWLHYNFLNYNTETVLGGYNFIDFTIHGGKLIQSCIYTDLLSSEGITNRTFAYRNILPDAIDNDAISAEHIEYQRIKNDSFAPGSITEDKLDISPLNGIKIADNTIESRSIINGSIPSVKFESDMFYGNEYSNETLPLPPPPDYESVLDLTSVGVPKKKCLVLFKIDGQYVITNHDDNPGDALLHFGNEWGTGTCQAEVKRTVHDDKNEVTTCFGITDKDGNLHYKMNEKYLHRYKRSWATISIIWFFELED